MTQKTHSNEKRRAELQALHELPDGQIDTTGIPELLDWTGARRGLFYRPVKQQIILRQHVERCEKEKTR